ncbi:protein FLUORESCENT IN BLUE LIGHT, chloroplastic-like isoform X2 [Aristolochia californica]|uniref:protein FLUORESCENT IN BLUE LIGHT, chloroplastic-like isoform X2 n=1 Tax=Aristolochia californica TaxID=171875 RepID=UPI0035E0E7D7
MTSKLKRPQCLNNAFGVIQLFKPEKLSAFLFKRRNLMMTFQEFSLGPLVKSLQRKSFSEIHSLGSNSDDIQIVDSGETSEIKLSFYTCNDQDHFFAHEVLLFSFSSALVLGLPFEALAETCEADSFSVLNMPLLFAIAMIGATVGGLLARQRRGELKRLNDQLRQINAALRRQAKIESYAPNLSYAPVGRVSEQEVIVDSRKQQLITNLRSGKNFLRNQEPDKAFLEFKTALELAQALGDPIEEKKAARGLGASLQRQGKYPEAVKYHSMVLKISERAGEDSGNTEAYGAIADCYTELGDLEQAGKFYDRYISRLETD